MPVRLSSFGAAMLCVAAGGCSSWNTDFALPPGTAANTGCLAVANERATDAGMIGEDRDTQRQVFQKTYANCTATSPEP